MKILAIRGKNIASLEGEFAIDFTAEPLASANIFAISGPTGAGKSSLLDTMCLALFARTPRTDQARELNVRLLDISDDALVQSDPRFLLRRGTASGYAETDFVALDGHRYRARWAVSRAREKESGRLQNPRLTLLNIDKDSEEQGTRSDLQQRIVELIGLTFEQFTRSVLLAQNDFSTFLKAEQGEKAALLEKLTGTELYSLISKRIYEKNAEARAAFDVIQSRISGIHLLTEEEESGLKEQAKESMGLLKQAEEDKKQWHALNESVRNTTASLRKKEEEQKEADERLAKSIQLRDKAERAMQTESKAVSELEQELKALQPLLQEARKLDIELVNADKQLQENKARLTGTENKNKDSEKKLKEIAGAIKQRETEKAAIGEWFIRYKDKEKIAGQLDTLLLHLDTAGRTRSGLEKSKLEETGISANINKLTDLKESANTSIRKKTEGIKVLNEDIAAIEDILKKTDIAAIEHQKETVLGEREKLLQEQLLFSSAGSDAKELRSKLSENTPCPVCGSMEHPYATQEVHEKMQAIQSRIIQLTQESNTLDKSLKDIAGKNKQLDKLRTALLSANKDLSDAEKNLNEHSNNINILNSRLQQLREVVAGHRQELDRALKATDALFGNDQWQYNWEENPSAFRQRLTDFVSEWQTKEKRRQELEQTLSGLSSQQSSYQEFAAGIRKEVEAAQDSYDKQNAVYTELALKRKQIIDGKPAGDVEKERQSLIEQKKKQLEQLQRLLTEQTGIAEQSRGQKEQITKDMSSLAASLTAAQTAQEAWLDKYNETAEGLMPEEKWTKTLERKTNIDFRLQTNEANKKQVAGLKEEADRKRLISEEWGKLNELAGSADGARFRRIAQSYTLDLLLSYANIQLQSLTNRYRLERVPDTLALQVIDRDMCDEIRTVHSLSGGESFLVSLALALGLSSLSSNRMKVESLFIDEGFGSLDAETLRLAMDALENLRTQGRKIGVISHVQEMTERIPVQIRITRQGSGKSSIEIV